MSTFSVDVIEWDGQRFCALMWPYLLVFEPGYSRGYELPVVDLTVVYTTDGRRLPIDTLPPERVDYARLLIVTAWRLWEELVGDSLLRQPAERIFCGEGYDPPMQRESVEQIMKRVGDRINRHRPRRSS